MGLFQEAAIIAGDLVTQPIRRKLAEKLTGMRFKIKRNNTIESHVHPTKPEIVTSHKVSWELILNNKQSKPSYRY